MDIKRDIVELQKNISRDKFNQCEIVNLSNTIFETYGYTEDVALTIARAFYIDENRMRNMRDKLQMHTFLEYMWKKWRYFEQAQEQIQEPVRKRKSVLLNITIHNNGPFDKHTRTYIFPARYFSNGKLEKWIISELDKESWTDFPVDEDNKGIYIMYHKKRIDGILLYDSEKDNLGMKPIDKRYVITQNMCV